MSYRKHSARKRRLTVSLSAGASRFLRTLRESSDAPSISGVVENLVSEKMRQQELDSIAARMNAYYDSLTPEEAQTERAWGEFGESQMEE